MNINVSVILNINVDTSDIPIAGIKRAVSKQMHRSITKVIVSGLTSVCDDVWSDWRTEEGSTIRTHLGVISVVRRKCEERR